MVSMHLPKLKPVEIMEIRGVKVFFHWSVLLIGALILLGAVEDPRLAFTVLAAYYALILIHECGHMIAAQQKGCTVSSIVLYPIWGVTYFSDPYSRRDHCIIAFSGVIAQIIVAAPLIAWVEIFGFTRFAAVNAILTILGYYSVLMAAFNLLPVPPLDGSIAWRLLPSLFRRRPAPITKRESHFRSWR